MNNILQWILIAGTICFFIFVAALVKKSYLQVKYALVWLAVALFYFVLAIFPGIVGAFANLLHIKEKVNSLFFITIFLLLLICFLYNLILSKQSKKIRFLIQEISILKNEIQKIKDEKEG